MNQLGNGQWRVSGDLSLIQKIVLWLDGKPPQRMAEILNGIGARSRPNGWRTLKLHGDLFTVGEMPNPRGGKMAALYALSAAGRKMAKELGAS